MSPVGGLPELSEADQRTVETLKARDQEVRTHEEAHKSAGGQYTGAISYEYQTGPDGKRYAIGGSVPIDVAPEDTPKATIDKMRVVIAAALAPAEPSAADHAVAQQAQSQMMAAQSELRTESRGEIVEVSPEEAAITALAVQTPGQAPDTAHNEVLEQMATEVYRALWGGMPDDSSSLSMVA